MGLLFEAIFDALAGLFLGRKIEGSTPYQQLNRWSIENRGKALSILAGFWLAFGGITAALILLL